MIVVGLGNPGSQYTQSRHNAGFMFVDKLHEELLSMNVPMSPWKRESAFDCEISKAQVGGNEIVLIKPMLFMNRSGEVVAKYMAKKGIDHYHKELYLAHDDLDIKLGEFKIQFGISPKGHNGVNDIESKLKSIEFNRLRIGVDDRVDRTIPSDQYVLQKLTPESSVKLEDSLSRAVESFISQFLK